MGKDKEEKRFGQISVYIRDPADQQRVKAAVEAVSARAGFDISISRWCEGAIMRAVRLVEEEQQETAAIGAARGRR